MHYATSLKVAGSILDYVIAFLQFTSSFQPLYDAGVDAASTRNEDKRREAQENFPMRQLDDSAYNKGQS
jgi:hypothetical protein